MYKIVPKKSTASTQPCSRHADRWFEEIEEQPYARFGCLERSRAYSEHELADFWMPIL